MSTYIKIYERGKYLEWNEYDVESGADDEDDDDEILLGKGVYRVDGFLGGGSLWILI